MQHLNPRNPAYLRRGRNSGMAPRMLCQVCGQAMGGSHDSAACADAWQAKLAEEGNPADTRIKRT